ncbi:hypothetical protein Tco_1190326 [Tanacetum coccineum]
MLATKCTTYNGRSTFANSKYIKKAQFEKPCLYEIPYDTSNPAIRFAPNGEETLTLANESISKLNKDTVKPYDYTYQNSLYENFKPPSQTYLDHNSFRNPTALDMEVLIKSLLMPLSNKSINDSYRFVHELKTEIHEDLEYVTSLEKEINKLESEKADFSNIYDLLLEECVSKDVMCSYLNSLSGLDALNELQCMYLHKVKECECLTLKLLKQTGSVNKEVHNNLLKSFSKLEQHSISLELTLQQCQEQMKNDTVCKENRSNVFLKEREQYHEIQDLNAQMQDKNIAIITQQTLPKDRKQAEINTNVIKPGMYRIASSITHTRAPQLPQTSRNTNPHVSTSTGINHSTSVSRPQLKSYQVKDMVMPNNSQVKFKGSEVEDHYRISSHSKKTKSVTACNNSLNSRTMNAIAVCADCGQCAFNLNHDACVSRYLNDVNARIKKPNVVHISNSKPKKKSNKSVATPLKKTVPSDTAIQKSNSYYKELITNVLKISNSLGSNLSNVPSTSNSIADCTVHFGNDQFAPILGYGDLIQGNVTIKRVYYIEGLNHNLFSVGQFCDANLEVAFRKSTCYVRDLQGNNLLTGNRGYDLYTIYLQATTSSTLICFMAKASPTQAWLLHRRLSYLNFDYINLLSKKDVVNGLPKLKYV